jgi:hypothetical protein
MVREAEPLEVARVALQRADDGPFPDNAAKALDQ